MFTTLDNSIASAIEHFNAESQKIRTGRAHPSLIADIKAEAYGNILPLSQLANITVSDARMLIVEPWDASLVKAIEKAIAGANLNASPVVDGKIIRITLPELTEETRKKLAKQVKEKLEDARVAIRRAREEAKKQVEKDAKASEITEDDRRDAIKTLDEKTKSAIEKLEQRAGQKEKEIMTV